MADILILTLKPGTTIAYCIKWGIWNTGPRGRGFSMDGSHPNDFALVRSNMEFSRYDGERFFRTGVLPGVPDRDPDTEWIFWPAAQLVWRLGWSESDPDSNPFKYHTHIQLVLPSDVEAARFAGTRRRIDIGATSVRIPPGPSGFQEIDLSLGGFFTRVATSDSVVDVLIGHGREDELPEIRLYVDSLPDPKKPDPPTFWTGLVNAFETTGHGDGDGPVEPF